MKRKFISISICILFCTIVDCGLAAAPWKHIRSSSITETRAFTGASSVSIAGFNDAEKGIAVYFTDYIYYTQDGGKSWTEGKKPPGSAYLGGLEIYNDHAWIFGENKLLTSGNGGIEWMELPRFGSIYANPVFSFLDDNIGWNGRKRELFRTGDGGVSWTAVSSPVKEDIFAMDMISSDAVVILEKKLLYLTANRGKTWQQIELPITYQPTPFQTHLPSAVRFYDDNSGTVVICQPKPKWHLKILQTTDGGTSWIREPFAPSGRLEFGSLFLSQDGKYLTVSDTINNRIALFEHN